MICLDPEAGDRDPKILQYLTEKHEGRAENYSAALVEGVVEASDEVAVLGSRGRLA
jgi:hypothetical protein